MAARSRQMGMMTCGAASRKNSTKSKMYIIEKYSVIYRL